jgi:hypothetical protein
MPESTDFFIKSPSVIFEKLGHSITTTTSG